jgi:hypothetical protein
MQQRRNRFTLQKRRLIVPFLMTAKTFMLATLEQAKKKK